MERLSRGPCVFLLAVVFAICVAASSSAVAQNQNAITIRGAITAIESPDSFDVAGSHVAVATSTELVSFYKTGKTAAQLRGDLKVGMYVQVVGTKDRNKQEITATRITLHDTSDRKVTGTGVIVRVTATGPETVVRAEGYTLRVKPETTLKFAGGLTKLDEVATNNWIQYAGTFNNKGEVILSSATFARLNLPDQKRDPKLVEQATVFPPGSFIDFDGGFRTDRGTHKMADSGGDCGWYPVVEDDAMQARVRRIGASLIPKYQQALAADDPTKIPFRFYVVVEKDVRTEVGCEEGLVLIPLEVAQRLQKDDQLAAVMSDGVAANLQRQKARYANQLTVIGIAQFGAHFAPGGASMGTGVAGDAMKRNIERKLEDERAGLALELMSDAGYDPWQAPEAWRLLAPGELPNDVTKLKYPQRSVHLTEILGLQYQKGTTEASVASSGGQPGSKQ
jgi:hypothetical protein